jgi:hypothetical protein
MSIQIKEILLHACTHICTRWTCILFIIKDQEDLIVYTAVSFFSFVVRTKKPSHLQRHYPWKKDRKIEGKKEGRKERRKERKKESRW